MSELLTMKVVNRWLAQLSTTADAGNFFSEAGCC